MTKKEHERICLDRFLEVIGKPVTSVTESEHPDFLIRFGQEAVGIEVTRLLPAGERGKDSPGAEMALRERVMRKAQEVYMALGGPPLHVSAIFLEHVPLSVGRVAELASAVARFLNTQAARLSPYCQNTIQPYDLTDELSEVASLHFIRVPSPDFGPWAAVRWLGPGCCRLRYRGRAASEREETRFVPVKRVGGLAPGSC